MTTLSHPTPITAPTRHGALLQGLASGGGAPDADEQPRSRGGRAARGAGRLRRRREGGAQLGLLRADRRHAAAAGERRDPAGAERQAGRRVPHPRRGAAGADRQRPPGAALGHLGRVPPARGAGPHHVRPDDRRLVDLHRHPGNPPGHLRDLRGVCPPALRRHPRGPAGRDRRPGRHGWRAAAGRDHERRRVSRRRRGRVAHPPPAWRRATATGWRPISTARSRLVEEARAKKRGAVGGAGRQHRRGAAGAGAARARARRAHRPDLGPRSARRLHPGRV